MRSLLGTSAAVALLLVACGRINISDDFRAPYEARGILMPRASQGFKLKGPAGVRVDIGLDFEENERQVDRLALRVGEGSTVRVGVKVPGSHMRRAVCSVRLTARGVSVDVENLNSLLSAEYSLRIVRSSRSLMCERARKLPSSALVRAPEAPPRSP